MKQILYLLNQGRKEVKPYIFLDSLYHLSHYNIKKNIIYRLEVCEEHFQLQLVGRIQVFSTCICRYIHQHEEVRKSIDQQKFSFQLPYHVIYIASQFQDAYIFFFLKIYLSLHQNFFQLFHKLKLYHHRNRRKE